MSSILSKEQREYYRKIYLNSPHWQFTRNLMLQLYPRCQICGSDHRLDVHHRNYHNLYDVTRNDLIVLCRRHHALIHAPTDSGTKPSKKLIEQRLVEMIPKPSPTREAYLALAHRFYLAARGIQNRYGLKLCPKVRKAVWSGLERAPDVHMFTALMFNKVNIQIRQTKTKQISVQTQKRAQADIPPHLREHFNNRRSYLKVAERYFAIARRIKREHAINVLPSARRVFFRTKIHLQSK